MSVNEPLTPVPSKAVPTRVWYIFIDVVGFTKRGRSMDDMVAIITALNSIVKVLLEKYHINSRNVITLATGDGMCLGLLKSTYEQQIRLAFELRDEVKSWNDRQLLTMWQFQLRTALHVYEDFRIKDINNKPNLIGHGINTAARILGLCDPGEIVASSHMYSSLERDGQFMHSFSGEKQEVIKGESYAYRRIELKAEDRVWEEDLIDAKSKLVSNDQKQQDPAFDISGSIPDPLSDFLATRERLDKLSTLPGEVGVPFEQSTVTEGPTSNLLVTPELLINEPFDERLINDDRLRYHVVNDRSWRPTISEPNKRVLLGFPAYSTEYKLKSPFRSFSALVSPNGENFKLVMKLMNEDGKLPVHMVFGEVSFSLRNDPNTSGMVLGYLEAGVNHERPLSDDPRPRFEVELKVRPVRTNKLYAAQLYIKGKLVQTKLIPKEYTARFGLVAMGNGKPCHMTLSEINVYTVAK